MEEILVTKTDIKIQSKQMQGLKNAVDELMLNNEYQLRLKDMNYKEKVCTYRKVVQEAVPERTEFHVWSTWVKGLTVTIPATRHQLEFPACVVTTTMYVRGTATIPSPTFSRGSVSNLQLVYHLNLS